MRERPERPDLDVPEWPECPWVWDRDPRPWCRAGVMWVKMLAMVATSWV